MMNRLESTLIKHVAVCVHRPFNHTGKLQFMVEVYRLNHCSNRPTVESSETREQCTVVMKHAEYAAAHVYFRVVDLK